MEKVKIKLITLTPIHIGSGNTITPLSWIRQGSMLFIINMDKFFSLLNQKEKEEYVRWVDSAVNTRSSLVLNDFMRDRIKKSISQVINNCTSYKVIFSSYPKKQGFKECVKTSDFYLYIPGTEIKGAIRTSILYSMIKENHKSFINLLEKFKVQISILQREDKGIKKKIGNCLRELSKKIENENLRGKKKDAKFDLFKLINVSDTSKLSSISRIETVQTMGSQRRYINYLETIPANANLLSELNIYNEEILIKELGLDRIKTWLQLDKILEACYIRSKDILENEKIYFKSYPEIYRMMNNLIVKNEPESPLLRLGAGQGFLGVTLNLDIKNSNPELYDEVIRKPLSILRRNWRIYSNFPKTKQVIINSNNKPSNLLGWVKISVE